MSGNLGMPRWDGGALHGCDVVHLLEFLAGVGGLAGVSVSSAGRVLAACWSRWYEGVRARWGSPALDRRRQGVRSGLGRGQVAVGEGSLLAGVARLCRVLVLGPATDATADCQSTR